METGQLELTVEHNGYYEGLEVVVLSPDYCSHELNWMHKKKRMEAWEQDNNVAISRVQACQAGPISWPVSESTRFLNGCQSLLH